MRTARLLVPALILALPAALQAQDYANPTKPIVGYAGITAQVAQPVGQFADYVGTGWGLGASFTLPFRNAPWLGLHAELGFVNYGHESRNVCINQTIGCRVTLDLNTDNNIIYGGVGPQLMVPAGPVRPYVNGALQFGYFGTMSSLSGSDNADSFANTTNFHDTVLAWSGGAGTAIVLHSGKTPVSLDLGATLHHNGMVRYLREGDITDDPDGSITLHPQQSQANLVVYRIGVRIGVR